MNTGIKIEKEKMGLNSLLEINSKEMKDTASGVASLEMRLEKARGILRINEEIGRTLENLEVLLANKKRLLSEAENTDTSDPKVSEPACTYAAASEVLKMNSRESGTLPLVEKSSEHEIARFIPRDGDGFYCAVREAVNFTKSPAGETVTVYSGTDAVYSVTGHALFGKKCYVPVVFRNNILQVLGEKCRCKKLTVNGYAQVLKLNERLSVRKMKLETCIHTTFGRVLSALYEISPGFYRLRMQPDSAIIGKKYKDHEVNMCLFKQDIEKLEQFYKDDDKIVVNYSMNDVSLPVIMTGKGFKVSLSRL